MNLNKICIKLKWYDEQIFHIIVSLSIWRTNVWWAPTASKAKATVFEVFDNEWQHSPQSNRGWVSLVWNDCCSTLAHKVFIFSQFELCNKYVVKTLFFQIWIEIFKMTTSEHTQSVSKFSPTLLNECSSRPCIHWRAWRPADSTVDCFIYSGKSYGTQLFFQRSQQS